MFYPIYLMSILADRLYFNNTIKIVTRFAIFLVNLLLCKKKIKKYM